MGKGSNRRLCLTGKEEEELRWKLALGQITSEQFEQEYQRLWQEGKIVRRGK